jgi:hypothetical protein
VAFNSVLVACVAAAAAKIVRAGRSLPSEAVPFLLFAGLAFSIHLLPSAEPRMLIPVLPALVWLIVHALVRPARAEEGVTARASGPGLVGSAASPAVYPQTTPQARRAR